ncbi:MAG: TonB-dependent receptor [candidate division WOR-3 bacterium]
MGYTYFTVIILFFQNPYNTYDSVFTNVYVINADQIKNLPVSNLGELLMLVPGVNRDYKTFHLRGSIGESEIAYYLDGVSFAEPEYINLNAIEKIEIQKSGFSAEYGAGFGGIIHIKTKKLKKKSMNVEYLTDDFVPFERLNFGYNQYGIDGQGRIKDNLCYFLSGNAVYTDVSSPGFYRVFSSGNCYNGLVGLTYSGNGGNSLSVQGYTFRDQRILWHPNIIGANAYKYFLQKPMVREKGKSIIITGDFLLGKKMVSSIKYLITMVDSVFGNRDYEWEENNGYQWYNDYRLKAEHLIAYLKNNQLSPSVVIRDSLTKYHQEGDKRSEKSLRYNPYGVREIFYTYGDYPAWCYCNSTVQQLFLKMKYFTGNQNEIKWGMDFAWNEFNYYSNPLPWFTQSLWNYYERTPSAISVYLEDKWITERIGICAGIRYSHFNYGLYQPLEFELPGDDTVFTLKKNFISPRIGLVLPVTKKLDIFFNGGEFHYEPAGYTGRCEPAKTRIFEMGCRLNPISNILITSNLYQKYMVDLYIQKVEYYNYYPWNYLYTYTFTYIDKAEAKGWEMNLEKLFGQWLSIGLSYNLQFTEQMPVYDYNYYYYYYEGNDPITGEPINYEKKYHPLNYDCRHSLKSFLIFNIPKDFHALLNNSTFSLFYSFYSGLPYTPEDLRGRPVGDINSARMPANNNVDMKYLKKFKIGPVCLSFNLLINNLFNTKQIVYVYPTTGKPDDHGDPEPPIGQFGWLSISSSYYSPQSDHNHDGLITPVEMRDEYLKARYDYFTNPLHYANPFRIRLGLGLELY